eukprot:2736844-Alexandrium_andersonii.AAC.1
MPPHSWPSADSTRRLALCTGADWEQMSHPWCFIHSLVRSLELLEMVSDCLLYTSPSPRD